MQRTFQILVTAQSGEELSHWGPTAELGRTLDVFRGLAATYALTPSFKARLVEIVDGQPGGAIGRIGNGAIELQCITTFDMHWCNAHGAVKPEGMPCAAVDEEARKLVEELERVGVFSADARRGREAQDPRWNDTCEECGAEIGQPCKPDCEREQ